MLRRKLMLFMGPLVLLLLATTAASIWLLQGVLQDLRHVKESAWVMVENIDELNVRFQATKSHLYELQTNRSRRLDELIDEVEAARKLVDRLGESYLMREPEYREAYERIQARYPSFQRHIGALATSQDAELARQHNEAALQAVVAIRQDTLPIGKVVHNHAQAEQEALLSWFRWLVLGMGLMFLLVINIAVVILLRTASIILRPIDRLVEATRELAAGRYDHRVTLGEKNEFDQLAQAYNTLAGQLQSDERQRLEMLGQVSLTMNHEINNAVAIIEMQLQLLKRQQASAPSAETEKRLREIHASLDRMTQVVQKLKNVKQVVLTDYVDGVKMLDLDRSTQEEATVEAR